MELKIDAQVILLKNLDVTRGLCNGSRGIVTRFTTSHRHPVVKFANGLEITIGTESFHLQSGGAIVATREQVPLELAWAISIHKSQGMSLDRAKVVLNHVFEYGNQVTVLYDMMPM